MDTDTRTALLRTLAEQVETLRTSDGWQHWLDVAAKFRTYSLSNQLLIAAQRPDATRVAGYRTWSQLGRQVRKGEHGIRIVAPLIRRMDSDAANGERRAVITGFKVVHVFDVTQTDGDPLPDMTIPTVATPDDGFLDQLVTAAQRAGISVERVEHAYDDGVHGWYERDKRQITLVTSYGLADQTRTMLHELAHACDTMQDNDIRSVRELVAESAAYIVGTGHLGLEMIDASALYVTSWGADADILEHLANRVRNTAHAVEQLIRTNPNTSA